jgi:hypothetical protein
LFAQTKMYRRTWKPARSSSSLGLHCHARSETLNLCGRNSEVVFVMGCIGEISFRTRRMRWERLAAAIPLQEYLGAITTGLSRAAQQTLAHTRFIFLCIQPEFITVVSFVKLRPPQSARFYGIVSVEAPGSNVFNASLRAFAFAFTRSFNGSEDFPSCQNSHSQHVSHGTHLAGPRRNIAVTMLTCLPSPLRAPLPSGREFHLSCAAARRPLALCLSSAASPQSDVDAATPRICRRCSQLSSSSGPCVFHVDVFGERGQFVAVAVRHSPRVIMLDDSHPPRFNRQGQVVRRPPGVEKPAIRTDVVWRWSCCWSADKDDPGCREEAHLFD